jgi:hypothetical protein
MSISNKQLLHYQSVAKQSLDKFKKIVQGKKADEVSRLLTSDWESFVNSSERIKRYAEHVDGAAGILGFSRELSDKLSDEALLSRVAERFAEIDLAEHAIRELGFPQSGGKLVKLTESFQKKCDFKYEEYHLEAKYTKNISISGLTDLVEGALGQIKNTIGGQKGRGCVWIFTYTQPDDPMQFQEEIEKIKESFSAIGFDFTLNVQVYGRGLYGDAIV